MGQTRGYHPSLLLFGDRLAFGSKEEWLGRKSIEIADVYVEMTVSILDKVL